MTAPGDLYDYARHMAGVVACDFLATDTAEGCIALYATQRRQAGAIKTALHLFRSSVADVGLDRDVAIHRVERAVWPLCQERRPGTQILAVAERAAGSIASPHDEALLQPDEVLALCRRIARQTLRRRPRARR